MLTKSPTLTEPADLLADGMSLGIDIGGTFTDLVLCDAEGCCVSSLKVLTTHADPVAGIMEGVARMLAGTGTAPGEIRRVVHATTLFTNALIERKGAATALLTTEGFRDVIAIARERRYELYDLSLTPAAPLVPRDLRFEIPERVKADGTVLRALDRDALLARVGEAVAAGVTSFAVVFLHADLYPAHEAEAAALIAAHFPDVSVTTSHEIVREVREYERGTTATANAFIKPLAEGYLQRLGARLTDFGVDPSCPLLMMLSSGGLTHLDEARRVPVHLLESGPAAGALAAATLAGGEETRLLAFDMGGTTAKLCVVEDGEPDVVFGFEAARQARFIEGSGLPIRISTVHLIEIGAGGGSIAYPDPLGLLKVGPRSAGSEPGPACYGRGGSEPTVTDANLLLGYLDAKSFAGGDIPLDVSAARAAIGELAARLGLSSEAIAWGIHDVVTEAMASAARTHLAERGRDPGAFTLVCTGGGGPLHGFNLARKLGIPRIVVPANAGVASALGLLTAPPRVDRLATLALALAQTTAPELTAAFAGLEDEGLAVLARGGWDAAEIDTLRSVDAKCAGQGTHIPVALPPMPWPQEAEDLRAMVMAAFHAAYAERYGREPPQVPIELVNARITLRGRSEALMLSAGAADAGAGGGRSRSVHFGDGPPLQAALHRREHLPVGFVGAGPALVEEDGSTLVVGPGATFTVLPTGNIVVELSHV